MAAKEDTFVASVDEKTMKLTFVSSRAVSQREAREIVQRMAKEKPGSVFVDLRFGTPVKFTQVVTYQPQEVELFGSSKTDDAADDAGDASSKAHAASDSASAPSGCRYNCLRLLKVVPKLDALNVGIGYGDNMAATIG